MKWPYFGHVLTFKFLFNGMRHDTVCKLLMSIGFDSLHCNLCSWAKVCFLELRWCQEVYTHTELVHVSFIRFSFLLVDSHLCRVSCVSHPASWDPLSIRWISGFQSCASASHLQRWFCCFLSIIHPSFFGPLTLHPSLVLSGSKSGRDYGRGLT